MPGDNPLQSRAQRDLLSGVVRGQRELEGRNVIAPQWKPQLIGSISSPTYDVGYMIGSFRRQHDWIFASFQMLFQTHVAGRGAYALRTPWVPAILVSGVGQVSGSWSASQTATGAVAGGQLVSVEATIPGNNHDFWFYTGGASAVGGLMSPTVPWTWANGDVLSGQLSFQVKQGY